MQCRVGLHKLNVFPTTCMKLKLDEDDHGMCKMKETNAIFADVATYFQLSNFEMKVEAKV